MTRRWPLRWKLAFYAAMLGVVATIAGAATTWTVMHYKELAVFDQRLASDAHELFRDLANFEGGWEKNRQAVQEKFVPLALRNRFVEIRGPKGEILYRSPNLSQSMASDGIESFHTRKVGARNLRIGTFHQGGLTLLVGADLREVNKIGWDIIYGMFAAIPTVLIVVVIGGKWVASRAVAPVEEIRQAAAKITAHNLDQRLPVPPTNDEIAGLISVLNKTFERLQRSFEQSVRFSADASHQLKTPAAVLRAGIEEILTDPETPAKQQARADALLHQTHQLTSLAENLLMLARADAGRLELQRAKFDLRELLDGILDDARTIAEPLNLTVEAEIPNALPVTGDRTFISIVLQNLLDNAVKYNITGGSICIRAKATGDNVDVTVANNGDPIPLERAPHIFDRFYRARGDQRTAGHGLGLSLARELTMAHGGELVLVRSDSEWTEFRLRLPVL
jgi:two-component system, OmpR family, heavy metal sensor histidine kinase CusS